MATATMDMQQDPSVNQPKKPEGYNAEGMIYPPSELRKMVDKTAEHVARKGPQLEDLIRKQYEHSAKFCFLNPADPYHPYYQLKLQEAREGKLPESPATPVEAPSAPTVEAKIPKEPEPFDFSAHMGTIPAQILDIMKLTAQFAARNGIHFVHQLAQRESRNYQFDFLRSDHSLFPYFTALMTQYKIVLRPPEDVKERIKERYGSKQSALQRAQERAEWVRWVEAEKKRKSEEDEKERLAYNSIDWNDFVVVQTVEFTEEDERVELPQPMSLLELENMVQAQKQLATMAQMVVEDELPEEEMDIEDDDMEVDVPATALPAAPALAPTVAPARAPIKVPAAVGPIKIRTDYKPRLGPNKRKEATQLCPRCGQPVPVSEMEEHMRIELMDPKWREQKEAMEQKKKESNLLQEGTDVAQILKNFSGYRSDIFGSEETEIGKKVSDNDEQQEQQ